MTLRYTEVLSKDTRYAYTTGRVRALELCLLKEGDFARMRQSGGIGEALQVLNKIFPYSESMKDIQKEEEIERGLDRELERRGHVFCRYADDCVPGEAVHEMRVGPS